MSRVETEKVCYTQVRWAARVAWHPSAVRLTCTVTVTQQTVCASATKDAVPPTTVDAARCLCRPLTSPLTLLSSPPVLSSSASWSSSSRFFSSGCAKHSFVWNQDSVLRPTYRSCLASWVKNDRTTTPRYSGNRKIPRDRVKLVNE